MYKSIIFLCAKFYLRWKLKLTGSLGCALQTFYLELWLNLGCKDHGLNCLAMVHMFWVIDFCIPNSTVEIYMEYSQRIVFFRASHACLDKSLLFIHKIRLWACNSLNQLIEYLLGVFCNSSLLWWIMSHAHLCCINPVNNSKFEGCNSGIYINLVCKKYIFSVC